MKPIDVPMVRRDLVFFDTETTDLDADDGWSGRGGEIVELAAVRTSADLRTERARVDLRCRISLRRTSVCPVDGVEFDQGLRYAPKALEVNGYQLPDGGPRWADAVHARAICLAFSTICDGRPDAEGAEGQPILVAQNAAMMDWPHVLAMYRREQLVPPRPRYILDPASMAWPLVVRGSLEKPGLETLCLRYDVPRVGAHTAMGDVRMMIEVVRKMLGMPHPPIAGRTP